MVNKSGNIGTHGETQIVRYVRRNGFPNADRLRQQGNKDIGDIGLCPGVIVESKWGNAAKNASPGQIDAWLVETEVERVHRGAAVGVLVAQRRGCGTARMAQQRAILPAWMQAELLGLPACRVPTPHAPVEYHLVDMLTLLRAAGYGEPLDTLDEPIPYQLTEAAVPTPPAIPGRST